MAVPSMQADAKPPVAASVAGALLFPACVAGNSLRLSTCTRRAFFANGKILSCSWPTGHGSKGKRPPVDSPCVSPTGGRGYARTGPA